MKVKVSLIKNTLARRAAMCAAFPFLLALTPVLGLLRGVIEVITLVETLVRSWAPVWRGDPMDVPHAEVGVLGGELRIHIPVGLLAFAAEHAPAAQGHLPQDPSRIEEERFRVTDRHEFAKSVGRALREEQDEQGTTMLHSMLDDAIAQVIDNGEPGFSWPGIGVD